MRGNLVSKYQFAKQIVCDEGFIDEIKWQENVCFNNLDESIFLKELAWVILSTGMKEQIIRKNFQKISICFFNWKSVKKIVANKKKCYHTAIKIFRNHRKITAIIQSCNMINDIGFNKLKRRILKNPIDTLKIFPFIGSVTVFHLAKNIGVCVAKPDRHLVRIAEKEGYDDVQYFCKLVADLSGDSIPVVDIVFWRFANLTDDYLNILSSINFQN